jgi:hypothetical protein
MKTQLSFISIIIGCTVLFCSCSSGGGGGGPESASQLTSDGWNAYAGRDYATASSKFSQAISVDGSFVDAYNGSGWSNAKLNNLASAVSVFMQGLAKDASNLEMDAGLAFVYNAQKDYVHSIESDSVVLQANPNWSFSHDASVNSSKLHLLLAADYYALANYSASYQQVQILDGSFNADVTTVAGQIALAQEIERLRSIV